MIRLECTGGGTHKRRTMARFEYNEVGSVGIWYGLPQGDLQVIEKATGEPIVGMPAPSDLPPIRTRLHVICPTCQRRFTVKDYSVLGPVFDALRLAGKTHLDLSRVLG